MRPVSMLSSLPPKFTPSRTNMMSLPCFWTNAAERVRAGRPAEVTPGGVRLARASTGDGRGPVTDPRSPSLLADAERLDDGPIAIDVLGLEVVQETPALADQHQQAAP